jgi:hypothetical protein
MRDVQTIKGFVAVIDVLGFRQMVARDDRLLAVRNYAATVVSLLNNTGNEESLQFVLFSDSLVINTGDERPESFENLIVACSNLAYALAQDQSVAVRGAIAYGSFMRSPTVDQGVILAGAPIVEADHYQHQQDWVGIMLAPSVVLREDLNLSARCDLGAKAMEDDADEWIKRNRLAVHLQHVPQIPFHQRSVLETNLYEGYAIVPMPKGQNSIRQLIDSLDLTCRQLRRMKAIAPEPTAQEKYSNTLRWVEGAVRSVWHSRVQ